MNLSAMGAYYPTQFEWPISAPPLEGLGALGQPPPGFVDAGMNALLTILRGTAGVPAVAPLYTLTGWGTRTGEVDWIETTRPEFDYLTYGISDGALDLSQQFAGLPGWIAILHSDLLKPDLVSGAFIDTPYKFHSLEAVYDQKDPAATPRLKFLAWGNLRDSADPGGGRQSMDQAARSIGGQLVFPIQIQHTAASKTAPVGGFASAMKNQFGVSISPGGGGTTPAIVPVVPTGRPSGQPPPPNQDRPTPGLVTASAGPSWGLAAGVGAAMFLGGLLITMSLRNGRSSRRRRR